jgi:ribulose-5-phosphate 4-epimerase/fuculose-1-phosphate aldolase
MANLTLLFSTLISAGHILDYTNVLDTFGHISVRNPNNNSTFFQSRAVAPALVSSAADIVEFNILDGQAVDPSAPRGFAERFIHSEVYKRYSCINSVVHSHAEEVIPFGVVPSVPMLPVA